jgi:hypothetical protein
MTHHQFLQSRATLSDLLFFLHTLSLTPLSNKPMLQVPLGSQSKFKKSFIPKPSSSEHFHFAFFKEDKRPTGTRNLYRHLLFKVSNSVTGTLETDNSFNRTKLDTMSLNHCNKKMTKKELRSTKVEHLSLIFSFCIRLASCTNWIKET